MRPDVAMGGPRRPPSDLGSAPVPAPGAADHVHGRQEAPLVIEYADFECPYCAALSLRLAERELRRVFRHFPVRSSHPRAWAAACAAEAAGAQGRFWEMHDLLFADQGRLEDPHLWQRARALGLDVERFDADRRSDAVLERVKRDFRSGVRAGVVTTPTLFAGGAQDSGKLDDRRLDALLSARSAEPRRPERSPAGTQEVGSA
jgi:protein-disulfide isomerase